MMNRLNKGLVPLLTSLWPNQFPQLQNEVINTTFLITLLALINICKTLKTVSGIFSMCYHYYIPEPNKSKCSINIWWWKNYQYPQWGRTFHIKVSSFGSQSSSKSLLFGLSMGQFHMVTFINVTTDPISKVCKYWEAVKLLMVDTQFPKFSFLLGTLNFTIGNKYCQWCTLKWQTHFIHFWHDVCHIPNSE